MMLKWSFFAVILLVGLSLVVSAPVDQGNNDSSQSDSVTVVNWLRSWRQTSTTFAPPTTYEPAEVTTSAWDYTTSAPSRLTTDTETPQVEVTTNAYGQRVVGSTVRPRLGSRPTATATTTTTAPEVNTNSISTTVAPQPEVVTNAYGQIVVGSTIRPRLGLRRTTPAPRPATVTVEPVSSRTRAVAIATGGGSVHVISDTRTSININRDRVPTADFIVSDDEYQRVLDRLRLEADSDVIANRDNYVRDDESVEEIMQRIEMMEKEAAARQQMMANEDHSDVPRAHHEHNDENAEECPICLNPIEQDDYVPPIPCMHKFHYSCLTSWKEQSSVYAQPNCPICRHPFSLN